MKKGEYKKLKIRVWERDNWVCVYCGLDMKELYQIWKRGEIKRKEAKITVDHVIPRQAPRVWKITTYENLVTACYPCNQIKGGRIK